MARPTLVLLLPGDPLTGLLTESGLRSYGFEVLVARTSAEALDVFCATRNIRVLVVDADLANGPSLAKTARSRDPDLHVIYTAREPNKLPDREKVGGAPCLRAPYHPHQLVGVISGLLRRPTMDDRGAEAAA
jgi:DNA-binding response OmpR family regulator